MGACRLICFVYPELVALRIPQGDPECVEWVEGVY